MTATHFSGPVVSTAGFITGDSDTISGVLGGTGLSTSAATAYAGGSTANQKFFANYINSTATTGDTRLLYDKLFFSGAGGSGEVHRIMGVVNNVTAATGGTVNGEHVSLYINGASGAVSGAGNALRVTLGGTATTPGGTLAAIQLDSDWDAGTSVPATASFLRVTDSGTGKTPNFAALPAPSNGTIFQAKTSAAVTHCLKVNAAGTTYYIMVSDTL